MIAGEPPFHGENHIDLLRNIQRKAVRLPKDVRVSKECVNLLRILLSRNPLTRAGFKEFFEACDAFVALGCQGLATIDEGSCKRPSIDLGTILENPSGPPLSESLMTVTTNAPSPQQALVKISTSLTPIAVSTTSAALTKPRSHMFSPLVPSPPTSSGTQMPSPSITEHPTISTKRSPQAIEMPTRRNDDGAIGLQNSADENSFVMVEHGSSVHKPPAESAVNSTAVVSHCGEAYKQDSRYRLEHSPPSSPGFLLNRIPVLPSRGDYMVVRQPKGMLSTSPGTGGALMGMAARPQLTAASNTNDSDKQLEWQIKAATKMLAAAEDVGRRAISVAHLGDKRAYFAMRMLMMNESSSSSILSATPMEGIEEESRDHDSGAVTDDGDSRSTEIMTSVRRRRSSTSIADKSMADIKAEDEADEMPFAMQSESAPPLSAGLPSRSTVSFNKDATISSSRPLAKPTPALIRSHFSEALACYLKALKMLKGAVGASKGVSIDSGRLAGFRLTPDQQNFTGQMRQRSEVTLNWLEDQFKGVLERGDAANTEIAKLPQPQNLSEQPALISIEELLYNHALGYGREGAVKQLLGHYEAARSCYRSAGLLAETLLMEPRIEGDDRKTLEGYVDGFAAQITELDEVLLQQSQSRLIASSSATSSYTSTRRGQPSVVSLVGNPFSMFSINK